MKHEHRYRFSGHKKEIKTVRYYATCEVPGCSWIKMTVTYEGPARPRIGVAEEVRTFTRKKKKLQKWYPGMAVVKR